LFSWGNFIIRFSNFSLSRRQLGKGGTRKTSMTGTRIARARKTTKTRKKTRTASTRTRKVRPGGVIAINQKVRITCTRKTRAACKRGTKAVSEKKVGETS
jgi:hypothetical protein